MHFASGSPWTFRVPPPPRSQGLKWAGTHGNAVPRPAISAVLCSQTSNIAFFLWKRTFPGRKLLSMRTQPVNLNLVKITNGLTRNTGALLPLQNWKGPTHFYRKIMIIIMIMTIAAGAYSKGRPARSQKIQYTKNKNWQWSSAKVAHELSQNDE